MRLADFIVANTEPILAEWEVFARNVWPSSKVDPAALRDHALEILQATALDMRSAQSATEQTDKSQGSRSARADDVGVDKASDVHAAARARSGFDMLAMVAEYRALRASVIRLWRESNPTPDLRDIDDLTRFNEAIDQSLTEAIRSFTKQIDRSRQMFLAILGHDLRTPLNAISLSAELLKLSSPLDQDEVETVGQISASATAMGQMIADLLDFTSTGLGSTMPLSVRPMDLRGVCESAVEEIHSAHPHLTVRLHCDGDLRGDWDEGRLRQLLSNLLGNAVQHGSATEPIDLRVDGFADEVRLTVHNSGPAIPDELLPTIFEPMVRGDPASQKKPRRPGSIGLGLYIARQVTIAHGGSLDVHSTDATGTLFTARLPRKSVS